MKKIVVLTGAGISQESGIKTFRDHNGLWENHPIEVVASPEAYTRDPSLVHHFYNLRREQLKEVNPNLAHLALAKLCQSKDFDLTIISQNVDDLHERAGAKNVIHMHGELRKIRNTSNGKIIYFEDSIKQEDFLIWRPDIVWFGESVKHMDKIETALLEAEVYLCIGTSNNVYPAAGFVNVIKQKGIPCIELNYERTSLSEYYDQSILGKATEIVPKFIRDYFGVEIE
jgi:NAD-dependent deacetylase